MVLLKLNRLMSSQQQRPRRRRGQIPDRSASLANGENNSNHQYNDSQNGGETKIYSGPELPEDIWRHIHSLISLQDAARAACVSHAFLSYWRCRPNITASWTTVGINEKVHGDQVKFARDFNRKVDCILKQRSSIGLKALKIEYCGYNANTWHYLDSWLKIAVTPELEELTLYIPLKVYSFPCSLLSDGGGNSIRHLDLNGCAFSTTIGPVCLRNLTSLILSYVRITGDELGSLFSNSIALERLELTSCDRIKCLKIPCVMQRLKCLKVFGCGRLKVIECKAPNLSSFHFSSGETVQFSLGELLQVKEMELIMNRSISYSCTKVPSIVPNLETLTLGSSYEVNTVMGTRAFAHLKCLNITVNYKAFAPNYDCFSLVNLLDTAPSLETFVFFVSEQRLKHESVLGDPSPLRQIEGRRHSSLKSVHIIGFCSAKCLVELICYILENAASLDCLTLDTTWGSDRCSFNHLGRCPPMRPELVRESERALLVVKEYIEGKVPPKNLEPEGATEEGRTKSIPASSSRLQNLYSGSDSTRPRAGIADLSKLASRNGMGHCTTFPLLLSA